MLHSLFQDQQVPCSLLFSPLFHSLVQPTPNCARNGPENPKLQITQNIYNWFQMPIGVAHLPPLPERISLANHA